MFWGSTFSNAQFTGTFACRKHITPPYIPPGTEGDCRQWTYDCRHDTVTVVLISLESAVFLAYFALFFFYLGRAFRQLRARNYRCALPQDWTSGVTSVYVISGAAMKVIKQMQCYAVPSCLHYICTLQAPTRF